MASTMTKGEHPMKTVNLSLASLMTALLFSGTALAYSHSNSWGGSSSHSYGSTSHESAWGTSSSHTYGEGSEHSNYYGGSTEHSAYGGTSHTNAYGGTTTGEAGYGAEHTNTYGQTSYASAYHPSSYYGYGYHPPTAYYGYHPPTTVNYYGSGCYNCGSGSSGRRCGRRQRGFGEYGGGYIERLCCWRRHRQREHLRRNSERLQRRR